MHRLLRRQLERIQPADPTEVLNALVEVVNSTYEQNERDRRSGDRANELMADELTEMAAIRERAILMESEKKIAEEASKAKSQFLANMSHELRTPLNAVIGYSELLKDSAEADARTQDVLDHDRIINAARRLLALINELLDLSKIEAGKMELHFASFDANALIADVASTVLKNIEENGNSLQVDIEGSIGLVISDEFRLGQCLLNLLSNAAKFTKNGQIRFGAKHEIRSDAEWLVFEIQDTGIGISAEQLERLFQPFVQADASTTRSYGGTGLGLTITRRIANLLGGDVDISSELGRGTLTTLRVPTSYDRQPVKIEEAHAKVAL